MQAYVSTVFASAAILGPMVGAFIVAHTNWSMVFWINVPLGIIAALLLAVTLRERVRPRRHRIDYLGSVLMALGIGTLMFALVQAARLTLGAFGALFVLSLGLLTVFLLHQRRVPEPMLPSSLWRDRMIGAGNVASLASGASMMGITAFLPAFIQDVMGYPPLVAGLALTAMSGGWPLGGYFGGQIMVRFTYRATAIAGGVIFVVGSLLMIDLTAARGPLWAIASAFFVGLGMGLTNNCFLVAIQNGAEWNQRGIATSSMVFTRILGQSVGAAAFGGILNAALASRTGGGDDLLTRLLEPRLRGSIVVADLGPTMAAFDVGLHRIYLIIGALAVVVLGCSVLLPAGLNPLRPRRQ
jgi:MFS family permease